MSTEADPRGGGGAASVRPPYFRPLMFFPKVPKFCTHEFYFQIVGNSIYAVSCLKIFPDPPQWASYLQCSQCRATPSLGWPATPLIRIPGSAPGQYVVDTDMRLFLYDFLQPFHSLPNKFSKYLYIFLGGGCGGGGGGGSPVDPVRLYL